MRASSAGLYQWQERSKTAKMESEWLTCVCSRYGLQSEGDGLTDEIPIRWIEVDRISAGILGGFEPGLRNGLEGGCDEQLLDAFELRQCSFCDGVIDQSYGFQ